MAVFSGNMRLLTATVGTVLALLTVKVASEDELKRFPLLMPDVRPVMVSGTHCKITAYQSLLLHSLEDDPVALLTYGGPCTGGLCTGGPCTG